VTGVFEARCVISRLYAQARAHTHTHTHTFFFLALAPEQQASNAQAGLWLKLAAALEHRLQTSSSPTSSTALTAPAPDSDASEKSRADEEEKRGLRRLSACVLIRLTDVLHQQEHHHEHGCPHLECTGAWSGGNVCAGPCSSSSPSSSSRPAMRRAPVSTKVLSSWVAEVPAVCRHARGCGSGSGQQACGEGASGGGRGPEEGQNGPPVGGAEGIGCGEMNKLSNESGSTDVGLGSGKGMGVYEAEAPMLVGPIEQTLVAEASYEDATKSGTGISSLLPSLPPSLPRPS